MHLSEIDELTTAVVEAADRAEGGRALSVPACTAVERAIRDRVGKIIDEREDAITDAMELERLRDQTLRRRTAAAARDAITRARTWAIRREVEG